MKIADLKYLAAYLVPLFCLAGLYFGGLASPGVLYFSFVLVPLIELFVPASINNHDEETMDVKGGKSFFDFLLYINVPVVYGIVAYYIWILGHRELTVFEIIFSILNVGVFLGVSAINVAHELGHRQRSFDQWMARLLLLPAMYSHFTLEHNYGHHLKVGTPDDPATASKNQPLYFFYFRSIGHGYVNAWKIGNRMLEMKKRSWWKNELVWSHVVQVVFLFIVFYFTSFQGLLMYMVTALVGILALESVNYIEHYGLRRQKLASGRYEPMTESHSWNSNHELGRIVLFELVRHADHHYQTTRKYQTLRHLEDSPQLPYGYPMSILIALVPPLWFRIMNKRLKPEGL